MMFKGTESIGTTDYKKEKTLLEKIDSLVQKIQSSQPGTNDPRQEELAALSQEIIKYQKPNEFDKIYAQVGGSDLNAYTGADLTSYHVTLPNDRMEFWAAMERDRILNPVFREFYKEKEVVLQERAQRVDTSDQDRLFEEFLFHAFQVSPYRYPIIGLREDLERISRQDLIRFYNDYYVPSNTVIAIVGNFDLDKTTEIITKYFGDIPKKESPPALSQSEREQKTQVRVRLTTDKEPFFVMGFLKPTLPNIDDTCFDVIQEILAGGKASRLEKSIVTKKHLASSINAYNGFPGARYDNLFIITSSPLPGHSNEEIESAIWKELERLKVELVSDKEIEKAIKTLKKSLITELETNEGSAELISYFEALTGDYSYIYKNIEAMETISPEKIMECANKYLRSEKAVIASMEK
jgi:predicted Zn-dependent peptidase